MSTDGNPREKPLEIEEELKDSYMSYAMSVIISRALPDVRDGLKPSQRRILVAMNDLGLGPSAGTVKCAAIVGETMKKYHPHGNEVIYPTLVRMAQPWNMRERLVEGQGNFGSVAGLPPAAMRYTEARLTPITAEMLRDLDLDTIDFAPTYDEKLTEPTVLPGKFPNLLVNGAGGIAVGMATSIPPQNLREICDAIIRVIDEPEVEVEELLEIVQGPDFPTGGIICGRRGIVDGYQTGRGNVTVRGRVKMEEVKGRTQIVITEIPYQQARDRVVEKIGELVRDERIKGISEVRDESSERSGEPVRIVIELKRGEEPEVILNQLYQYSPLQDTFSIILLALVDGQPRTLNLKEMIREYVRHRVTVVRRRTQCLLRQARQRSHLVEGQLIALARIDEIIETIRTSDTVAEARVRLMGLSVSAEWMRRALGDEGFALLEKQRGVQAAYSLTRIQADAILQMQLQRLTGMEKEKLVKEFNELRAQIADYELLLSEERRILDVIREDMHELKEKFGNNRRTEISEEEIEEFAAEDLIPDELMAVTISHQGYIKRIPLTSYRAQRRGGKGITGAETKEDDFLEHIFVASTHAYILFFTDRGKVYWRKVYNLPQLGRASRGRAIVNMLQLAPDEKLSSQIPVREFSQGALLMATRHGVVKKTSLSAFSRPMRGGIIAIKLDEGDELISTVVTHAGHEVLLSTRKGMAIRFPEEQAREMGRATHGVKGIKLAADDEVIGMVVVEPEASLLTVCEQGYGKRTPFGERQLGEESAEEVEEPTEAAGAEPAEAEPSAEGAAEAGAEAETGPRDSSSLRYRSQRRGGKGIRDIKTTARNGPVVGVVSVRDDDQVIMTTTAGMVVRIPVEDIRVIGRNTQGVRVIRLDAGDKLVSITKVPKEDDQGAGGPTRRPAAEAAPPPAGDSALEEEGAERADDESAGDGEES